MDTVHRTVWSGLNLRDNEAPGSLSRLCPKPRRIVKDKFVKEARSNYHRIKSGSIRLVTVHNFLGNEKRLVARCCQCNRTLRVKVVNWESQIDWIDGNETCAKVAAMV